MRKTLGIAAATLAISFVITATAALAQSPTASPSPSASPSPTTVPSAAPSTGRG